MSVEDFQMIDDTVSDNSIIKRHFSKIYHQQGANLNESDKKRRHFWRKRQLISNL